jgi:energy-coupling factor transporter ATP-binding protein EcfA2
MSFIIPEFKARIIDSGFTPEDEDTKHLYKEVEAFAKQGQPIVIFGPAGSGKEFLARHYYSAFVKSEIYQQYKTIWKSKYNEIRNCYSAFYSGKSLDLYLSSIKPGIFQSINSTTIYPNLAESILFGHEENSTTGVSARPGLLELIKCGVLFIEEIGELSKDLQAKLLRIFNSEISEGCRISGKINYSLKDIIIIPATNQPQDEIRKTFFYKMGIQVNIKSIDERPKDVRKSIPHFIGKAIDKRKDSSVISRLFRISGTEEISRLSETKEIRTFAEDQANLVADEILIRKWPGNFRALRTALEASILRIEKPKEAMSFSEEFRKNLGYYITQYSDDAEKTSVFVAKSFTDTVYPSRYPDLDRRILEELNSKKKLNDISGFEKKILANFLSSTHKTGFMRRDLEEYYKEHSSIRHTSEAHIRSKINKLAILKILNKTGEGKSTRYNLTNSFLKQIKNDDFFSLPDIDNAWADRSKEIDDLGRKLLSIQRVYIQAPAGFGKTAFIAMFCNVMQERYNFYYYPLGEAGINKMFEDIMKLLQSKKISLDPDKLLKDAVNNIQPFLKEIFNTKEGEKPVLILDNAHFVSDPDGIEIIAELARKWQEVILVLSGDKMDNTFQEYFHEMKLGPWGKQA